MQLPNYVYLLTIQHHFQLAVVLKTFIELKVSVNYETTRKLQAKAKLEGFHKNITFHGHSSSIIWSYPAHFLTPSSKNKTISDIFSKESFSYVSGNEDPEKIPYILGNGTFFYFSRRKP